jgi:hypothetical protein
MPKKVRFDGLDQQLNTPLAFCAGTMKMTYIQEPCVLQFPTPKTVVT